MPKNAAELAIKSHVLVSAGVPEFREAALTIKEAAELISLTEAPEDAVCSLVIDLMRYCERENIDWTQDVIARAQQRF
jgi:hypothetical protein